MPSLDPGRDLSAVGHDFSGSLSVSVQSWPPFLRIPIGICPRIIWIPVEICLELPRFFRIPIGICPRFLRILVGIYPELAA
eukprot:g43220.t1